MKTYKLTTSSTDQTIFINIQILSSTFLIDIIHMKTYKLTTSTDQIIFIKIQILSPTYLTLNFHQHFPK